MFEANIHNVRNDLQVLMKDAQALFNEAASAGGAKADELRAKGMDMLEHAIEHSHELQKAALERGKKLAHDTDSYVHEHPWRAVGAAAAIGLMLGMLISRR